MKTIVNYKVLLQIVRQTVQEASRLLDGGTPSARARIFTSKRFLQILSLLFFLTTMISQASYTYNPEYKRELFYEIRLGKDPNFGYDNNRFFSGRGTMRPYNMLADTRGNIWVVDHIKKRCVIITKDKQIKIYCQGKEFEKIDKEMHFRVLAVDDTKVLLGRGIIDRKTKEILVRSIPDYCGGFTISAGFTGDGGYFYNSIPLANRSAVFNNKGKTSIAFLSGYPESSYKKPALCSYYFSPQQNKSYSLTRFLNKMYLKDNPNTFRIESDSLSTTDYICFVDKHGSIYFSDCSFLGCGDPMETKLAIFNPKSKKTKEFTFHRALPCRKTSYLNFFKYSNEIYPIINSSNINDKTYLLGYEENVIGFTYEGVIYNTLYIPGDSVKIFRLIPNNKKN